MPAKDDTNITYLHKKYTHAECEKILYFCRRILRFVEMLRIAYGIIFKRNKNTKKNMCSINKNEKTK